MKNPRLFVVDAFTDRIFSGNTAAICLSEHELDDSLMQNIAMENRFSETAFITPLHIGWNLRWFTPGGEIDLCGHATLASAYIIFKYYETGSKKIVFHTKSGPLPVLKDGAFYSMDFPAFAIHQVEVTEQMADAVGARPIEAWLGRDLLCVFDREETVKALDPDLEKVKKLDGLLFHATAAGTKYDCVSRSFAPKLAVPEDPVCGSGHCEIVPYWAKKFGKSDIMAWQASRRGGMLKCRLNGDRVIIAGQAAPYSEGYLLL